MKTRAQYWLMLFGILLLPLIVPSRAAADEDDPPSRVARLSYINGQVSFSPAGADDWVAAVLNRPITTGDNSGLTRIARLNCTSVQLLFVWASKRDFPFSTWTIT